MKFLPDHLLLNLKCFIMSRIGIRILVNLVSPIVNSQWMKSVSNKMRALLVASISLFSVNHFFGIFDFRSITVRFSEKYSFYLKSNKRGLVTTVVFVLSRWSAQILKSTLNEITGKEEIMSWKICNQMRSDFGRKIIVSVRK